MILDASAALSVILNEEEGSVVLPCLIKHRRSLNMSVIGRWEITAKIFVLDEPQLDDVLDRFDEAFPCRLIDVDREQLSLATHAWKTYGKKSGHKAKLNMGDCFAYALTKLRDEPLLFIGNDFSQTDVRSAL